MHIMTVIENDAHFQTEMANAGTKLVVVDFTATWYPQYPRTASFFEQLPAKYPRAVFLKVDVDRCETAEAQDIISMPTLMFFRNRTKIDSLQGTVDPSSLENKVKQYYGTEEAGDEDSAVAGHANLT